MGGHTVRYSFSAHTVRMLPIGLEDAAFDRQHYNIPVADLEPHN